MPYFLCRLATEDGRLRSETFLATSRDECRSHFENQGFYVVSVKRDWKRDPVSLWALDKRIRDKDFILFNQDLMALIKAGYPVLRGLEIISLRVKNLQLKEILLKVQGDIRSGKTMSEAFLPYEKRFGAVYIASLMAGEQSGNLAGTLARYLHYSKSISQTKSRIRSALIYPTLLLIFSFTLLMLLLNFILPQFSSFYADVDAELPGVSRTLMAFSLFVRRSMTVVAPLLVLLIGAYFVMKRRPQTRLWIDRLKLGLPYARTIWVESGVSLFSRTLSLLLEAGITLVSSLGISTLAIPNLHLVKRMDSVPADIKNGQGLSESLTKPGFFPPLALDMIRIGETSANLAGMLAEVADAYDERVRNRIDTFVSLIEPVIIIIMGFLVAFMLLSVYLPIFNIINVTR